MHLFNNKVYIWMEIMDSHLNSLMFLRLIGKNLIDNSSRWVISFQLIAVREILTFNKLEVQWMIEEIKEGKLLKTSK